MGQAANHPCRPDHSGHPDYADASDLGKAVERLRVQRYLWHQLTRTDRDVPAKQAHRSRLNASLVLINALMGTDMQVHLADSVREVLRDRICQ